MANSVNATLEPKLQVSLTLDIQEAQLADPVVAAGLATVSKTLNASSTPAVSRALRTRVTLAAGAGNLDLTALAGAAVTEDWTGLKVQAVHLRCPSTNTQPIAVDPAATNGYDIFGTTGLVNVAPGGECLFYSPEGLPDIAAGAKDIQFAGTGSEIIDVVLLAG